MFARNDLQSYPCEELKNCRISQSKIHLIFFANFQLPFGGFFGFRIVKDFGIYNLRMIRSLRGVTDATVCFSKK